MAMQDEKQLSLDGRLRPQLIESARAPAVAFFFFATLLTVGACDAWAQGNRGGPQAPSLEDEKLQRQLLAEILQEPAPVAVQRKREVDETASVEPVAARDGAAARSRGQTSSDEAVGVGTAVASVPTWPVLGLMVLLAAVLFWLKRGGHLGAGQNKAINKLAMVPLGGKRSIALVDVLGQKLVLGLSEKGLNLLTRIEGESLPPSVAGHEEAVDTSDPFEGELRDLLAGDDANYGNGSVGSDERHEIARKLKDLRMF